MARRTSRQRRGNAQRWHSAYMRVSQELTDAELAEVQQAQRDLLDCRLSTEQRRLAYWKAFPQALYPRQGEETRP